MRVGSDTGGTFTDLVDETGSVVKVLSTPADPSRALAGGLRALGEAASVPGTLTHGTTVATNAVLERRGATVALITNEGFADVIEIARQDRPSLYDTFADRPEPLVPRRLRYEVSGRLAADGSEICPLDIASLGKIDSSVEVAAVCLLHSDLNPAHEAAVRSTLEQRGLAVTCSSDLAPEFREYERTSTVVMNAYVRPRVSSYLRSLEALAGEVLVMTSAGGLVPVEEAVAEPVRLLLSGPAGGVRAGAFYAELNGFADAVTFDMGGTSTDVCLVQGGRPAPAAQRTMAGFPVRMPALDVLTIGAGGGSIAEVDAGGALKVGPRSAGALPGPACYGRGGSLATVTDANLVAGRIIADAELGDLGRLDRNAAVAALASSGLSAADVLAVVNSNMLWALRQVTVERGVDPRTLALVAFGGAGGLHACDLAEALGMPAVIVPPRAGALSAVGILGGPRQHDVVRSWPTPNLHEGLPEEAGDLARSAMEAISDSPPPASTLRFQRQSVDSLDIGGTHQVGVSGAGVDVSVSFDCRYGGQSHELTVASPQLFHEEHRRRNGYAREGDLVEVVALRVRATVASPVELGGLPEVRREPVEGPAVLAEADSSTWVPEGWRADTGAAGVWVIRRKG